LKEILAVGEKACDCKRCEKIGDAVIALNAPRNLRLEHTDSSFDYLCPSIKQPHCKHSSETQVVMNISNINLENNSDE
jgi:ADP-heptose:LPS heptosyltransferase